MKPLLLLRRVRTACAAPLVLAAILALFVCAAPLTARAAAWRLARLTEKTLPPEEMPPTATPTPAAPGSTQSGTAVASPTPSPSAENGSAQAVPETTIAPVEAEPAAEGTLGAESTPGAEGTPGAGTETAPASPVAAESNLAPLGIGAVTPQVQVSDQPLTAEIQAASSPSMAASIRIVDHAREAILGGRPNDAIEMLTHALSVDPADAYAYFYLGRAWLAERNYDQAITFLKRAEIGFSTNPQWLGETLAFEGLAYEESGDTAAAKSAYQTAMDEEPGNLMARVGYTRLVAQSTPTPTATSAEPAAIPGASAVTPPPPAEPPPPPPPAEPPPAD